MALDLPTHRADHTPIYVFQRDNAWDTDRLDYEFAVIEGDRKHEDGRPPIPWASVSQHPWHRYHAGQARCDLSTVEDYLIEERDPVRFVLRRLDLHEWHQVRTLQESRDMIAAKIYALRRGLVDIQGMELKLKRKNGRLTDQGLATLRNSIGDEGYEILGALIIVCSQKLGAAEKKP